jgi:hypothetical protein
MGMYKSNLSPEQEKARSNVESVDAFLARGGKIENVNGKQRDKSLKVNNGKIDAQALLDAAIKNGQEKEVIAFLESQGIKVD